MRLSEFFDKDNQGFGETLPPIGFKDSFHQMEEPSFWSGMEFTNWVIGSLVLLFLLGAGLYLSVVGL